MSFCIYHGSKCPFGFVCRLGAPLNAINTLSSATSHSRSYHARLPMYYPKNSSSTTYSTSDTTRSYTKITNCQAALGFVSMATLVAGVIAPFFVHPLYGTGLFMLGIAGIIFLKV